MPLLEVTKVLTEKGIAETDPIFQEIKSTYDLAGATEKIKTANKDLTTQREQWESERKILKGYQTEVETLKGQIATLTAGNRDGQNTLEITRLKTELEATASQFNAFKTEAESAKREAREEKMRSSILSLAGANKAINSDEVFMLMKSSGCVVTGDDGKITYARKNVKGEMESATADEAVKSFLEARPYMVASSGHKGSGGNAGQGRAGEDFNPMDHLVRKQ